MALAGVAATEKHVLVADREINDTIDVFRCLDASTGKELWAVRYLTKGKLDYGNSPRATPLIATLPGENDARVFLFGAHGQLRCVDLATGHPLWQRDIIKGYGVTEELPWGFCGSPLLAEGNLVLAPGAPNASIVAINPATGKTVWQTPGKPASFGSLIAGTLGGKFQIVGHDSTTLGGWDPSTGKRLWTVTPKSKKDFHVPTSLIDRGQLIVPTETQGVRMYRFESEGQIAPEPAAAFEDLKPDTHTPVIVGDRLFGVRGNLYCLDLKNSLALIYKAKDPLFNEHTSLFASSDRVLICCDTGELILIDAKADSFNALGRMQIFDDEHGLLSHPALVGTRLYMRGSREIVCVDLGE